MLELNKLYNMDCMQGMTDYPDGYFDLAITDPPYGIGIQTMNFTKTGAVRPSRKSAATRKDYRNTGDWDIKPDKEYFDELRRVSKHQIIWGGNYFSDVLPPSKSFIVWDKRCGTYTNDFADCELAWCSDGMGVARICRFLWNGMLQGNMKNKETRFHPTQKPVALYLWCLENYSKPGYRILDTHTGSASSLIACYRLGLDFVGFEIDTKYYNLAGERLTQEMSQLRMIDIVEGGGYL